MNSLRHFACFLFVAGSPFAAPTVCAQAFDAVRLYGAAPGQDGGSVGAALLNSREYQGSDERRTQVLPLLDYQWANGWFAGTGNGLGYNFSRSPQFQYGLRLTADMGRDEGRSVALRGLGDVDAKLEGGAFFNYLLPQGFVLSSSVRYGAGQNGRGVVIDLGAGWSSPLGPKWRLGAGAALTVANADYMQSLFGVTAAQSVRSGYGVYTPDAGVRDLRASASLSYALSPRTTITGATSVSTLLGDARGSPLTRRTSTWSSVLAVSRAF